MKDYYKVKAISNTSLSWFQQSPLAFQRYLEGLIDQEPKTWGIQGSLIHEFLLEPEEFEKNYEHFDYETPKTEQQKLFCREVADRGNKRTPTLTDIYSKTYTVRSKSDEKIKKEAIALQKKYEGYITYLKKSKLVKGILSESQYNLLHGIKNEINLHTAASKLMEIEGLNEFAIYFNDINTKLECKALIDRLIINKTDKELILIDIKTCNTFKNFKDRIKEYNYDRQLAFYWRAVFHHLRGEDLEGYKFKTYIIAINIKDLTEVKVIEIPEPLLSEADDEVKRLLLRLAWHFEEDKWQHTREYYNNNGIDKL